MKEESGKTEYTNNNSLIPKEGYVLLCNDNPSELDEHMRRMTYLTTISHEEMTGPV